jgi:DNA repair exonuclease SbcCD ATPase subunit
MPSIEELQAQLATRIAELDKERQENAKRAKEEREKMLLDAEIERQEHLEAYQAKIAEHEAKKRAEEAAVELRRQAELTERLATEQKQNALDETLRLQREKLEWLETAISNAEFTEEQHRKSLENSRIILPALLEPSDVSAEYPQTSAEGGAAADGTDGNTPETPLMSSHLKSILRQATRQY